MPTFDRAAFLNAIERVALLFDNGISSSMGGSIRRDAELLLEVIEWDATHNTTFAHAHAKNIFDNAVHLRGYREVYAESATPEDLADACVILAESVRELAGAQIEKPTSKSRRMLKKFGAAK
jgi:hypothetical protein